MLIVAFVCHLSHASLHQQPNAPLFAPNQIQPLGRDSINAGIRGVRREREWKGCCTGYKKCRNMINSIFHGWYKGLTILESLLPPKCSYIKVHCPNLKSNGGASRIVNIKNIKSLREEGWTRIMLFRAGTYYEHIASGCWVLVDGAWWQKCPSVVASK